MYSGGGLDVDAETFLDLDSGCTSDWDWDWDWNWDWDSGCVCVSVWGCVVRDSGCDAVGFEGEGRVAVSVMVG